MEQHEAQVRGLSASIVNDKSYPFLKLAILAEAIKWNAIQDINPSNGTKGALKVFERLEELAEGYSPRNEEKSPPPKETPKSTKRPADPDLDDSPRY